MQVEWLPFELRPEGVPALPRDPERMRRGWERSVLPLARQLGVEIQAPAAHPHTRLAHEAFAFARGAGRAAEMAAGLFRAHFVAGRDIGSIDELVAVGAAAGVDAAGLRGCLEGRTLAAEVGEGLALAGDIGVTAVPTFLIGRYAIPGLVGLPALRQAVAEAVGGPAAAAEIPPNT